MSAGRDPAASAWAPEVAWEDALHAYMTACVGSPSWAATRAALAAPPAATCVRAATAAAADAVQARAMAAGWPTARVEGLEAVVLVRGSGPHGARSGALPTIVLARVAAEAVLRGAPAYAPGVLAAGRAAVGDRVRVVAAVEPPGSGTNRGAHGVTRGTMLRGGDDCPVAPGAALVLLGVGTARLASWAFFAEGAAGVAVDMTEPIWRAPSESSLLTDAPAALVQQLASAVAASALGASGASRVLDMCAAPGGKTTAIAAGLGVGGSLLALDRSAARAARVAALAQRLGVADRVTVAVADSSKLFDDDDDARPPCPGLASSRAAPAARAARKAAARGEPPPPPPATRAGARPPSLTPASFTHVLLDAPCSATGLRPRLAQPAGAAFVTACATTQKSMLRHAVTALAPGGVLIYSTCSVAPAENEAVVAWALARFGGCLTLDTVPLPAGVAASPGLTGSGPCVADSPRSEPWLAPADAARVARFDPAAPRPPGAAAGGEDTIGFFVARFVKR